MSNGLKAMTIVIVFFIVIAGTVVSADMFRQYAQSKFDQDPGYENSTYVGHFTESAELRRIDDVEKGVVCYKVTYDKAISCVFTGEFGDGVINQQEY